MAHEISHVRNYDIRVSMIAFGLVSAIALLSDIALRMMFFSGDRRDSGSNPIVLIIGIVLIILAPIIAMMVQMAVSRQREYLADASGVMATRDANPLKANGFTKLFSTHPPLEERIARLRKNANKF
jgi:heat shock protein HtpX